MSEPKIVTRLIYEGEIFQIAAYVISSGEAPAEEWLDSLSI